MAGTPNDREAVYLVVLLEIGDEPEDYFSELHTQWQLRVRECLYKHGLVEDHRTEHGTVLLSFYIWLTKQRREALSSQAGESIDE